MLLDTAWTNTPAGYPARRSATCNVRVTSLYLFFRTPRTAGLLCRLPIPHTRSLTLALLAKTPVRTEVQGWTTPPARRAPLGEGCFAPVEEVFGFGCS